MKKLFLFILLVLPGLAVISHTQCPADGCASLGREPETLQSLARQFDAPPDTYKPHAWWHWLGSNFSKDGITRDLVAMKEAGIGGVVVFNAPSWIDPKQNPWPQQTYRSDAYWEALRHALAEAKRLQMTVGIQNSPGWSTTGGPWISPEQGMQAAAFSVTKIRGGKKIKQELPNPQEGDRTAPYFKDVAIMAVPVSDTISSGDILDLSADFAAGVLEWQAPAGEWKVYRFGHYPTMSLSHPAPEDVADCSFEVDKMDPEATVKHWNHVLNPLKEQFGEYIGNTFNYIWIDSYEAGMQNWSPNFRTDFIWIKGYDPVRQVILAYERGDSILDSGTHGLRLEDTFSAHSQHFLQDYKEVINRLFMNCWQLGKEMVNKAGFRLCWEPYCSVGENFFDMFEGLGIADIPVTEFWVHSKNVMGSEILAQAAAKYDKRLVGAEAFTGMERTCTYTETPAMLKRPADMGYSQGVNLYFLHSWAHNPWDDRLLPGWSFAHYGTHFSRNQTWFEPGKAFFTYLARCQMLLQQGSFVSNTDHVLHRRTPDAEIFFISNAGEAVEKEYSFPVTGCIPELWDAYKGIISKTNKWKQENDRTTVTLRLEKDESVFVVFPLQETSYDKQPERVVAKETAVALTGEWTVTFCPKTGEKPFQKKWAELKDFSVQKDKDIKYFSGTAVYEKKIKINNADLRPGRRITIDLGELYDLAELEVNDRKVAVLWSPPYRADITSFLKTGENTLKIAVTNTWVNRLIGDEQYPEDFEWTDKNQGLRAMTGLPEWFVKGKPRPVKERKAFVPWYYFSKDSPLSRAGLLGPVKINYQILASEVLSVSDLRCEYMKEPLGIDNPYCREQLVDFKGFSPRISWKIAGGKEQESQAAYRVVVSDRLEELEYDRQGVWDSGVVTDNRQFCFIPDSVILPGKDYYWKVGIYGNDKHICHWSEPARFSTGLLRKDWKGEWITHPSAAKESHIWFRKKFMIADDVAISGPFFAYVASLGYHELYVNGVKVDNRVLAPAVSRIDKRVLYATYDIRKWIKKGSNVIAINYGPGWSMNNYFAERTGQGILVQLYGNDKKISVCSDATWLCSEGYSRNIGHFDFMDMGGELVDGQKYTDQWMMPAFDDRSWEHAAEKEMKQWPVLSAQMTDPTRVIDTIPAKNILEIRDPQEQNPARNTIYRVDMGKEFTGFLDAEFGGLSKGDTIEIMVSMRASNPEFVQATYGIGPYVIEEQKQRQLYIARGEDGEKFCNRFNFFAGRYIHFKGLKKAPDLRQIKGLAVSSAAEATATFACSDSLYNQLFAMDMYTYQMCNTEGVTVDCPNRERLGYGPEGAYQTMWGLGLPCFNSSSYYIKNVRDWADVQSENGFINNVAPQISVMYGCVLNGTAILNIAWEHYRMYGDKRILEMAYPVGKKWLDFLDTYTRDSLLTPYDTHGYFLGDWVSPGPVFEYAETEEALFFNNCAYAMALDYMIKIADALQEQTGSQEINKKKLQALRQALHSKYYNPETGSYLNGDQVRTSFALYAGIVPDTLRGSVEAYFEKLLEEQQYINVGSFGRFPYYKTILGNPRLHRILAAMLAKKTYPGYGYFIEKGCTTFPEMWEIDRPNSTVIHTSYTGVSAFFFRSLAGINELAPGCDTILIAPDPVGHLSWCSAGMETPYGKVESAWKKERNGHITYTFSIPSGMTARIRIGNEAEKVVSGGNYCFVD